MQAISPLQVIAAHRSGVWSLCSCPGSHLVSGGGDGLLKSWVVDARTGRLLFRAEIATPHTEVLLVHRSQHGILISAGHHGGLAVWELESTAGEFGSRQRLSLSEDREEHTDRLLETRTGHLFAWVVQGKLPPRVWRWSESERAFFFQQFLPLEQASVLLELPSGEILSGDGAGRIIIWRLDEATGNWQAREELQAHEGPLRALAWTGEDTLISVGGDAPVLEVWRWLPERRTLVPHQVLQGHRSRVLQVVESAPAEIISNDQGVRLLFFGWWRRPEMWVWRKGPEGFHLVQRQVGMLRRCLDGELIVDEQGESLTLWSRAGETYEQRAVLTGGHQGLVLTLEPLPSGGLITGGLDGNLASWSLGSRL